MAPKGVNAKQAAGRERKAAQAAEKKAAAEREQEKATAADWQKGSNQRGTIRAESAAQKADEAARKRREKAELLAAEEAETGGKTARKLKANTTTKKKKKNKNDLSLLEDTLVGDADKKAKAAKKAERIKREREERLRLEKEKKMAASVAQDPLLANTDAQLGLVGGDTAMDVDGRAFLGEGNISSSGIDSALNTLSMSGDKARLDEDKHPEKRMKALHKAFEERMLPQLKEEQPGLRMSQYKERVFALWKKSPENPMNTIERK